ncbi:MAG: xanthine dehydrogenase family protein [Alphaproteobacteria bacterium]|nr:xanthine dehydrogenase family protein [Alphaproteobacteria bacterium]
MTARNIGQSLARLEDDRFLRGRGDYVADREARGCLHLHVIRSPHGHAAIRRIESRAALAAPGLRAIYTEPDLSRAGLGNIPCITAFDATEPMIVPPRPALARGVVRHVGDPVACVVADSADAALAAAELVEIEYELLPCVVDARAALAAGAPQLWPEAMGNSAFLYRKGDAAAVAAAMASAAHIVECDLANNRVAIAPMEARAAIGHYDAAADCLHLVFTGQAVHGTRRQLAEQIFKVPAGKLRLTVPDVGGGFGVKNFVYPEWVLVLFAARALGRPVRWVSERIEDFIASTQGRDFHARARLALDAEGRFLALEVKAIANMGAYLSTNGPISSTTAAASAMGGVYAIPAVTTEVRGAFTNTQPVDAYRGAGKPEANYVIERLVDLAAARTGIDAAELRRRNIIASFPYRTAMGMEIDGGRFGANIEDALRLSDAGGYAARREASGARGRLRGRGIACFLETARGLPNEFASAAFEADGMVTLAVGTQSNGQGHETAYPQIAADLLGLPVARMRFRQGDTTLLPGGGGHGGARSMHLGGSALVEAVEGLIERGRQIAAHLLQASVADIGFAAGRYSLRGSDRGMDIDAVAEAARDPANLPDGAKPGLSFQANYISDLYTFPNGCHVAEVEIDPETGATRLDRYLLVDDYGTLVNPMLTLGQVHGGLAQGIGQALLEHVVFDPESGQLLSGSFMDYALPRADDLPRFDGLLSAEAPTRVNRLGAKGAGQAGAIAAPPVVMNAILDALAPLGVRNLDMPATPERVWRAILAARRAR